MNWQNYAPCHNGITSLNISPVFYFLSKTLFYAVPTVLAHKSWTLLTGNLPPGSTKYRSDPVLELESGSGRICTFRTRITELRFRIRERKIYGSTTLICIIAEWPGSHWAYCCFQCTWKSSLLVVKSVGFLQKLQTHRWGISGERFAPCRTQQSRGTNRGKLCSLSV